MLLRSNPRFCPIFRPSGVVAVIFALKKGPSGLIAVIFALKKGPRGVIGVIFALKFTMKYTGFFSRYRFCARISGKLSIIFRKLPKINWPNILRLR